MKSIPRTLRTTFSFGRLSLAVLLAATLVVGFLFTLNSLKSGANAGISKVSAAQVQFQGGATPEMLAYALNFKSATNFAVFSGHGVQNRGQSNFRGNVGSTGTLDGVPNTSDLSGTNYGQAKQDISDSMRVIDQLPCLNVDYSDLTGRTFDPGVYCLSSANLAGVMTLNGGDDPNSTFVFRVAGDFSTGAGSSVVLSDGASATNVYFVAHGDITVGAGSDIESNLVSSDKITVAADSTVGGKTIGINGDVNIDTSTLGAGTGDVEICKLLAPGDAIPAGTIFNFTISGVAGSFQVPAGGCSAPISVAAGNVTVTEAVAANTAVVSIVTTPPDRRVSFSLALRQAVVSVPEGDVNNQTVVTFTNQTTRTGTIEICKTALDSNVTGIFQFTVQGAPGQTFAVPTGFCSGPITVTILQIPGTPFTANVTELASPTFRLEQVTTLPAGRLTGPFTPDQGFDQNGNPISNVNGGFANVLLVTNGGPSQQTTVIFGNRSLPGRIKVCKITADPVNIPVGTSFRFTVSGLAPTSPTQTTPGVQTTVTVDVLAGPNSQGGFCNFAPGTWIVGTPITVTEVSLTPGFTLPFGLTFNDVRVSRIRSSSTPLVFNLVAKAAQFPAVNATAEVEFTDFIFRPAVLKLCKIAGTGVAAGTNFNFTLALADPLTSFALTQTTASVPAGACTFLNGPFPAIEGFPGIGTFNFNTGIVVTEGAAAGTTVTAITSPSGGPITGLSLPGRTGTITLNQLATAGNFNEISFTNSSPLPPPASAVRFDFDGDGGADPVIFRPSTGTWWWGASSAGGSLRATQWGMANDRLVAADYDGDGKTDFAVYRGGTWYILNSSNGSFTGVSFGLATDIPQPGDYDGDGKADMAVYRPSEGTWYLLMSRDGFAAFRFGLPSDIPVAGDYDGDGRMDAAVYRGGVWYINGSTSGFQAYSFGMATDLPVPADYDGDHKVDAAVFRNGFWYILGSQSGFYGFPFGTTGDVPVPADYDGDGKTDPSVYRPSTNVWYELRSNQSAASGSGGFNAFQFGSAGDLTANY